MTKGVTEKAPKIKSFIINRLEMPVMKHLLLTTIAAVLLVGCGECALRHGSDVFFSRKFEDQNNCFRVPHLSQCTVVL